MRLLVTGATGFIGGALARGALARGWSVAAAHRGTDPARLQGGIDWRTLDEWERSAPDPRCEVIVHAAAQRHRHGVPPGEYLRTNQDLTTRVIGLAQRHAARLVHISSIAVYGWPRQLPIDESFPPRPVYEYGRSKVHCEELVRAAGIPYTIVQPSITYGPGDTGGMMDKILHLIARRRFVVPGLGRTRVQLVYIDDLVGLTLDAAVADRTRGQSFILTYRDPIRVVDLVRLAARTVGAWVPPLGPPRPLLKLGARVLELVDRLHAFDPEPPLTREKLATVSVDRAYRIDRMRTLLGAEPAVGYAEGLKRTARALGLAD